MMLSKRTKISKPSNKRWSYARKLALKWAASFVIGLIGETKEDIEKTIEFAYKLRRLGADTIPSSVSPCHFTAQNFMNKPKWAVF